MRGTLGVVQIGESEDFGSPSLLQRPQCCTGRVGFIPPRSRREWEGIRTASSTRRADPSPAFHSAHSRTAASPQACQVKVPGLFWSPKRL